MEQKKKSGLAIASLVIGIVALVFKGGELRKRKYGYLFYLYYLV